MIVAGEGSATTGINSYIVGCKYNQGYINKKRACELIVT